MRLSSIWSDGMVLQRGKVNRLRGFALGNKVTVLFTDKCYEASVNEDSSFEIELEPLPAGGPYEMVLYDGEKTVIRDILVGDVWVLGGQSNMELPIKRTLDVSYADIKGVTNDRIRMFQVPQEYCFDGPKEYLEAGDWKKVDPVGVMDFSAVGYFLASFLQKKYEIPVGLIQTAIGGTPVEAWMSEESLRNFGGYEAVLSRNKDRDYVNEVQSKDNSRITNWHNRMNALDFGLQGKKWFESSIEREFVDTITIPGMWDNTELHDYKGSVWFRREFEVPGDWIGKEVKLRLGAIIDGDTAYVNGVLVGQTAYRYPPRNYLIPQGILKKGTNQITVRVFSDGQQGGFMPGKQYGLEYKDQFIPLHGEWRYRIGAPMERLEPQTFFQYEPSGVYNGMIAPLKATGICGVAFYQGESNCNDPSRYSQKFGTMMQDWRKVFAQGEVPFLFVQLANFGNGTLHDRNTDWAMLRAEQENALKEPNTAMVVTIDVGEYNDLHPQNKKEVGRRMALAAAKLVYQEADILAQGPRIRSAMTNGKCVTMLFDQAPNGLALKEGKVRNLFTLVQGEREEMPLPKITGNQVILDIPQGMVPEEVRYAWCNNPPDLNIYNTNGLPMQPFCVKIDIAR